MAAAVAAAQVLLGKPLKTLLPGPAAMACNRQFRALRFFTQAVAVAVQIKPPAVQQALAGLVVAAQVRKDSAAPQPLAPPTQVAAVAAAKTPAQTVAPALSLSATRSDMDVIFDTQSGLLSIDPSAAQSHGATVRAVLNRHGQEVNLIGVEMRLQITANGAAVFDMYLPPAQVQYIKTDQDMLATAQVQWQPGQNIAAHAWCKTSLGTEAAADAAFVSPVAPVYDGPETEDA